jgi:GAF domain-containing protein/HAMP domain-containing protein
MNSLKYMDFPVPTMLSANPDTVAVYFGGVAGETLYYPNIDLANVVPPDFDVTKRPWFVKAAPAANPDHKAVWSDPYLDAALHGLVITASVPVFDATGNFRGVAAMDIQLKQITDIVSKIRVGDTGYAFLIDRDKRLIAMPDAGYKDLGITADVLPLGEVLDQSKVSAQIAPQFWAILDRMTLGQMGLETTQISGVDRFVVYEPIPEVGYNLAIIVPSQELLSGSLTAKQQIAEVTRNTISVSLLLVAAILSLSLLAALGIGNRLTLPLRALTQTAEDITGGNLAAEAQVRGQDEIGTLGRALNTMTATLRDLIQSLEQRVKERTSALETASRHAEHRATQLEAITEVTRAINSIRNMDELLPRVASLISEHFGYYHVGIFLNDETNQFELLSAANSEGGQRMLARGHALQIGQQGIVGHVAATGETRVAHNVGQDVVFFNNPDLPETKSEAAIPLRIGKKVIGVLDMQSIEENAFSQEDIGVLAILADQVSLAIDNTRLYETTRRSLTEAETLYRQYLRQAWARLPSEQQLAGFHYTPRGATPLETPLNLPAEIEDEKGSGEAASRLAVPIRLRGETIGSLVVRVPQQRRWSQEEIDLVQAVAERIALSAENARLFDETSRRAERERLVTEITSKIRSANRPEEMIQTALDELRNALGAAQVKLIPQIVSASQQRAEQVVSSPQEPAQRGPRGDGAKK